MLLLGVHSDRDPTRKIRHLSRAMKKGVDNDFAVFSVSFCSLRPLHSGTNRRNKEKCHTKRSMNEKKWPKTLNKGKLNSPAVARMCTGDARWLRSEPRSATCCHSLPLSATLCHSLPLAATKYKMKVIQLANVAGGHSICLHVTATRCFSATGDVMSDQWVGGAVVEWLSGGWALVALCARLAFMQWLGS